ncbi:MAG TPA: hypothetical protein DCO93_00600 [Clostridiales bacterium]|nr:hypothetical protein [Clostridiales bacterium]
MNALGMIEVYGFTTALYAADIMVKAANVDLIAFDRNRPGSADVPAPLVMIVKVEGSASDVKAAVEAGKEYAEDKGRYIISHIIAHPDTDAEKMAYLCDINRDKYNKKMPKSMKNVSSYGIVFSGALGILEVEGYVCAVEALDTMLKAANVRLVHKEERLGGRLVTLIVTGEISAVRASIEAGSANAGKYNRVYGKEVIARPHRELLKFFDLESINN